MKKKSPTILVLGATGFVGQTVFSYLSSLYTTIGTAQKARQKNIHKLTIATYEKDFAAIKKRVKDIDMVINCIGVYKDISLEDMIVTNALFPHYLETLAQKHSFRLIHISTDAVFNTLQGKVNEQTVPHPTSFYGMSKLLGETQSMQALTIRSSFIGRDVLQKKGLIEYVLGNKQIEGFSNQTWSGCTTLQFAMLCQSLIDPVTFSTLRKRSSFFHFAPLPQITKYDLLKKIAAAYKHSVVIKKVTSDKVSRFLSSQFAKELFLASYESDYESALHNLQKSYPVR